MGVSSSTRGLTGGGETPSAKVNTIEYVTINSTGNATDFGDLTQARVYGSQGTTNSIRGVFVGGKTPSIVATMDYVTIASTGTAADFGDLSEASQYMAAGSDSNGGLQSA